MCQKMKKKIKRIISLALTAVCLAAVPCTEIAAAETNAVAVEEVEVLEATVRALPGSENMPMLRTMFSQCFVTVECTSAGMIVEVRVGTTGVASYIGVKDIKIQKKVWYGWSTVATSSGGEVADAIAMTCNVTYANAEKGETYRVLCTYYADVNGYDELEGSSNEVVFDY